MSGAVVRGRVVSCKMQKTISVLVERSVKHSLYGKYISRSKKYQVRDEQGLALVGDVVEIQETRPYSKTVSFRLKTIVRSVASSNSLGKEIVA